MARKRSKSETAIYVAKNGADAVAWTAGGVMRLIARGIGTLLLIGITSGLLFTIVFAYYVKTSLMTETDITLDDFKLDYTSSIYYQNSAGEYELLTNLYAEEDRVWVDYKNIPMNMEHAAVAIEDFRFYKHKGVDWYRTAGAFVNMFLGMRDNFGGSTITQQLIKNVTKKDDVTVERKLLEIFTALEFEKTYKKDQIIEWYLNSVNFGGKIYGIGAAAKTYFDKEVWELSLAECASIVGITNNPSMYDPRVSTENNKKRRNIILYEMYDQGYITKSEYDEAVLEEVVIKQGEDSVAQQEVLSWYVENVIKDVIRDIAETKNLDYEVAKRLVYSAGYQIYACIDMDIQNIIDEVYTNLDNIPKPQNNPTQQLQSAIVVMDPYDGRIVGVSGGIGEKTVNMGYDRATYAKRSPGSSFKPVAVYGPAYDMGYITQTTLVNDSPNKQLNGISNWYPKNSGGAVYGTVDIRTAVQKSINTIAAQVLDRIGLDMSYKYLTERLGFESMTIEDKLYATLSLGQFEEGVTVREMAQAYSAFVNDGVFTYGRFYSHVVDPEGVVVLDNSPERISAFKPNTAWNITDMLYNAVTSGTGSEAAMGWMNVAGKTGTTSFDYDRYFVGYTPYYVAAVWTGYDQNEAMRFGYSNPAARLWKQVMEPIHQMKGLENKPFPEPTIDPPTNLFDDAFIPESTETPEVSEEPEVSTSPSPSPGDEASPPPVTSPPVTEPPVVTDPPITPPPVVPDPPEQPDPEPGAEE